MVLARFVIVILLFSIPPAMAANWSGLYLGQSRDNGYTAFQIIETKDGSIVGRYRQVVVTENGPQTNLDVPVSGALQGNLIVGRIERTWFQGGVIAFSGTRTSLGIQISGGDGLQATLTSSSERDERAAISELQTRAKKLGHANRVAKSQRDAIQRAKSGLTEIEKALKKVEEFKTAANKTFSLLGNGSAHFEAVTARQEKMAAHSRTLRDEFARSQLSVEMSQLALEKLSRAQIEVERHESNAMASSETVAHHLSTANALCTKRDAAGPYETEYISKCKLVGPAKDTLEKLSQDLRVLFNRLDSAAKTAEARSDALIAEVGTIP